MSQRWSKDEVELLRRKYPYKNNEALSEELGRSVQSLHSKASREGISKADGFNVINSLQNCGVVSLNDVSDYNAGFVCGFITGEGSFLHTEQKFRNIDKFSIRIELTRDDKDVLVDVRNILSCGNIYEYSPRKSNERGSAVFTVQSIGKLWNKVIPIIDHYGLKNSIKQEQYNTWRNEMKSQLPEIPKDLSTYKP